jgi:outer membrane immunogenic protein
MFKKIIAVLAASVGVCGAASAADLGGSLKDDVAPVAAYSPIWTGLYVGGSVGFGVGDTSGQLKSFEYGGDPKTAAVAREVEDRGIDFSSLFSSDYDVDGAIYGAHIGYNWQRGPVVFGVEAGLNGTDINGQDTVRSILGLIDINSERELDWYATLVGRLGYASGNTLFYGFGGVAWATVDTTLSVPLLGFSTSGESDHVGWTAGVGIEYAMSERFSVRVEYSHVDLGEETATLGVGDFRIKDDVDLSFDAIKIGASYRFGGRDHLEALK